MKKWQMAVVSLVMSVLVVSTASASDPVNADIYTLKLGKNHYQVSGTSTSLIERLYLGTNANIRALEPVSSSLITRFLGLGPTWGTIQVESGRTYTNVTAGDDLYYDVVVRNDSNEAIRLARWTYDFTDISSNSEDATVSLAIPIAGTYTEVLKLNASGLTAAAGLVATIETNYIVSTKGIKTDYIVAFTGSGSITVSNNVAMDGNRITGAGYLGSTGGTITTISNTTLTSVNAGIVTVTAGGSISAGTNITATGNVGGADVNATDDMSCNDDFTATGTVTAVDDLVIGDDSTFAGQMINTPVAYKYTGAALQITQTVAEAVFTIQTSYTNTLVFAAPATAGQAFEMWNICATNVHIPTNATMYCTSEMVFGEKTVAKFRALGTTAWYLCYTNKL